MAWYRAGGGGIPSSLKSDMNDVLNKKFGTSTTYPAEGWPDNVNLMGPLPEKTVSGAIVTFSDGADAVPLKKCEITLPASLDGYSQVDAVQTGRNLVALNVSPDHATVKNGVTINTQTSNTLNMTTTGVAYACERLFYKLRKGTYTARFLATSSDSYTPKVALYKYPSGSLITSSFASNEAKTFTLTDDTIVDIRLFASGNADTTIRTVEYTNFQLESGSSATTYEPYTIPDTHTADLGRTIYGGSVDVVAGEGVDGYGRIIFNGSSNEGWQKHGSIASWFYIDNAITDGYVNNSENDFMICNEGTQAKYSGVAQITNGQFALGFITDRYRFVFKNTDYTEVEDFKTWLSNNNMQIVYKLATPADFTFAPVPIDSKLGNNTLWSEQGSAEVTYRADINIALGGQ